MYALKYLWDIIEEVQSSEGGRVQPEMIHPILRTALIRADANVYERARKLLESTDDGDDSSDSFESLNSKQTSLEFDIQAAVLENNPEKIVELLETLKTERMLPR